MGNACSAILIARGKSLYPRSWIDSLPWKVLILLKLLLILLVLRWFDGRGRRRRSSECSMREERTCVLWGGGGVEMPSSSLLIPYQAHNYRATKQAINQPGFNDVQSWLPFDKSVAKVTIVLISVDGLHLRTRTRHNYTVAPGPGRHQLFNHCVLLNNGQGSVLRLLKA